MTLLVYFVNWRSCCHLSVSLWPVVAQICINILELVRLFADLPALERAECCFTGTLTGLCLPALCRK